MLPFVASELVLFFLYALIVYIFLPYAFVPMIVSVMGVYTVAKFLYGGFARINLIGYAVLLAATYIMFISMTFNIQSFCDSSSLFAPVLNNVDSNKFYESAKYILRNDWDVPVQYYYGYPYLICALWSITGINILTPLVVNILFTLLSISMAGIISERIFAGFPESRRSFISALSMLFTTAVCFYIGCGTVVLKEPMIYLGLTLGIYAIAGLYNPNPSKKQTVTDIILYFLAVALLFLTRHSMIFMLIFGILLFARKYNWKRAVVLLVLSVAGISATYTVVGNSTERDAEIVSGENLESANYLSRNEDGSRDAFNKSMEGYFDYPVWKKAAVLPYTASVQYFIPFFWTRHNSVKYGPAQVYSHFGFLWYIVGGLVIFYILFGRKFSNTPKAMILLLLIAAAGYLIPAYMFAGSVSRYWLPFTPIFAIVAAYVVSGVKEDIMLRPLLKKYAVGYVTLVVVVLVTCYLITTI